MDLQIKKLEKLIGWTRFLVYKEEKEQVVSTMLAEKFSDNVKSLIDYLDHEQKENIKKAADLIIESVVNKGAVHVFDTGHIVNSELINRAGGLALFKTIRYVFSVEDPVFSRDKAIDKNDIEGLGELILKQSNVQQDDVMILGSVSGKSVNIIDLALAAKRKGAKTVVITSVPYSSSVKSQHSSGKKLYQLGDVVIDNGAPAGDATLEVAGIRNRFGPVSGLGAAYAMWLVSAHVIEGLIARGLEPTVFKSINQPDGTDNYQQMCDQYAKTGV